jgi:hypothetical protein
MPSVVLVGVSQCIEIADLVARREAPISTGKRLPSVILKFVHTLLGQDVQPAIY